MSHKFHSHVDLEKEIDFHCELVSGLFIKRIRRLSTPDKLINILIN